MKPANGCITLHGALSTAAFDKSFFVNAIIMSAKSALQTSKKSSSADVEFDVREDEEQGVKLNQIIDLLLAAGYFRARIKGLSPFDKVVGGMVWCISVCSYDIDVDLLFQENSTIGQKIALTEKIVVALKCMKCPHRIEPHQIQGLDFIHVYPVVQWLVKRAIETKTESGDYVRAFSVSQFNKSHSMPDDITFSQLKERAVGAVSTVKTAYRPVRKYRHHDASKIQVEEIRVQTTLLEYGRHGLTRLIAGDSSAQNKSAKDNESAHAEDEQKSLETLMRDMSVTGRQEGRLTASGVGSIIGLQSQQIQSIAAEYAERQQTELSKAERETGGIQHQQRAIAALRKQIDQQSAKLNEMIRKYKEQKQIYDERSIEGQKLQETEKAIDDEIAELDEIERQADAEILQKLRSLILLNESLKRQEVEFRENCKHEMEQLQQKIKDLEGSGIEQKKENDDLIEKQYQADKEKLNKIRLVLAKRNRDIATLQRKIDEVPTRAELSQYQKRFVELYNQVASKHKETKRFYTMYNTLDDTKMFLEKEVNLLNSINDTFEQAMSSPATKEQFLKQFEQIVESVKQSRAKVEKRKQEEKMKRDQLNDTVLELAEQRRRYFKAVKDFQEECRKNEILQAKLQAHDN